MHGFMWYFHADHHKKTIKVGLNEMIYFIIYAVPSWLLIMFGMMNQFGTHGLVLVFYMV
jgi:beta-carotene 3-hydroxylase